MIRLLVIATAIIALLGCKNNISVKENKQVLTDTVVWLSDSAWYAKGMKSRLACNDTLFAILETDVVESPIGEDAADDPAFWYNKSYPNKSLILGTNKINGLHVFDIKGKITQTIKCGAINNVDLRDGFQIKNKEVVIVAGSNRSSNSISLFTINKETLILSDSIANLKSNIEGVYGLCMHHNKSNNKYYVYVNSKDGDIEQWLINIKENKISGNKINSINIGDQCEGMVVDDETTTLYIGVENVGIIQMDAISLKDKKWLKDSQMKLNSKIAPDIEGLALFSMKHRKFLLASSQGNFSYAIFEIGNTQRYINSFIIDDKYIDGVEETDGIEIFDAYINDQFPEGILIVQDGHNFNDDLKVQQNFKYISLNHILELID